MLLIFLLLLASFFQLVVYSVCSQPRTKSKPCIILTTCKKFVRLYISYNVYQKSLEHPYSAKNFPPPSYFRCRNDNCEPLPPLYNVESIAEALSYLERHHFSLHCYSYHLQTTLLYGGRDFVVRLQHISQEVFQDFWQTLYLRGHRKFKKIDENHTWQHCIHILHIIFGLFRIWMR